jgi:glycosyltransferase involved in cell wall biosynthesis
MHTCPYEEEARLWSLEGNPLVTAISRYQWSAFPGLTPAAVIHHGVDVDEFTLRPEPDDYLLYMGRFTPGKGPLQAISTVRELGCRLVLAGPENEYFHAEVAPHVDGRAVQFAGFVSGRTRDRLLGGARALLYPLFEPEPFGLVQVEAMLCGTPVAAVGIGAVPEIVEPGVTGHYSHTVDGLCEAVVRALSLDRRQVRARAEQRFSLQRMAQEYLQVYERVAAGRAT